MGFFNKLKNKINSQKDVYAEKDISKIKNKSSFKYLNALLHSEQKIITLNEDIALEDSDKDKFKKGIVIDVDDIIIDGNGHSINANENTGIFHFTGKNITIKNIILKCGTAENGGAIYNEGKIHMENVKFMDNISIEDWERYPNKSYKRDYASGGAIFNKGELSIENCVFENNKGLSGGAIFNKGELSIESCVFENNRCEGNALGGAIFNGKYKLVINNSKFLNNSSINGGAIYNKGELIIKNSNLIENSSKRGGAIDVHGGNVSIYDCCFEGNVANGNISVKKNGVNHVDPNGGGAIFTSNANVIIKNTNFIKNLSIVNGGVMENAGAQLKMFDCIFKQNGAGYDGGVIYNSREGLIEISDAVIEDNDANGCGGVIRNIHGGIKIFNNDISRNTSPINIIANEEYMEVQNIVFKENISENIISNEESSNLSIIGGKFLDNDIKCSCLFNKGHSYIDAVNWEGYLEMQHYYIYNDSDLILNKIKLNNAYESIFNGGKINIKSIDDLSRFIVNKGNIIGSSNIIEDNRFDFTRLDELIHENNNDEIILEHDISLEDYESDFYEGGIELDRDGLKIDGKGHTIDGKELSRIFIITSKDITLKNIIFKNGHSFKNYYNLFNGDGASIKNYRKCNLRIENCEFIDNESEENAGAISNYGELIIHETKFMDNSAKNAGSIDNNMAGELTLSNVEFISNDSHKNGGAISNKGKLTSIGNKFLKNNSVNGAAIYNEGKLNIINNKFIENNSDLGGTIDNLKEGTVELKEGVFESNVTVLGGGAIVNEGYFNIEKSVFFKNYSMTTTYQDGSSHGGAGAISNRSKGKLEILHCTFKENKGYSGGVIENYESQNFEGFLSISNTKFICNSGVFGGVIHNNFYGKISIEDAEFKNNLSNFGGVIFNLRNGEIKVFNSIISKNSALVDGGVIYNEKEGIIKLSDCKLDGNTPNKKNVKSVEDYLG